MAPPINKLPPRIAPRGLTIAQAAAFAGVTESAFNAARLRGDYPDPTLFGQRIDLKLLEKHMDRLSGILSESDIADPLDEWERRRATRQA